MRVYVNGRAVDVPAGATLLDAVQAFDADVAGAVAKGARALTDSRGLPVAHDAPAFMGAIVRVVSGRRARAEGDA